MKTLLAACLVCVGLVGAAPLQAQALRAPAAAPAPLRAPAAPRAAIRVTLEAGNGRLIEAPDGTSDIFVADPKVVDVRPANASNLFIFGVGPGHTTVAVLDHDGHPGTSFDVTVTPSSFAAGQAAAAIAKAIPGSQIQVDTSPHSLVLTGHVASAAIAEEAQAIAHGFLAEGQDVESRLTIAAPQQVGLRVRIVEMTRAVTNALGINWQALGRIGSALNQQPFQIGLTTALTGSALTLGTNGPPNMAVKNVPNIDAMINALATENLARVLAEPNLTAMSGEQASFLAGGEFPIPVGQSNNTVSIEFKQYGVALSFVPTVISDRQIRLHVRPEVSELTQQGSVQISAGNSAISVPALTVRRADTTVEVGSGQSFAIAGLLQYNANTMANYLPLLGDVPVLGELFRSESFQRNETELVIIVTPYLVTPKDNAETLRVPGEAGRPLSDLEILAARRSGTAGATLPRPLGAAGFMMP